MTGDELSDLIGAALAPMVAFLSENMPTIERAADAYDAWGINRLEALANGYNDADDPSWRA